MVAGQIQPEERSIVLNRIITKNRHFSNGNTLIVAVDVGMKLNMGYCRCPDGKDMKPFSFRNDGRGFKSLLDRIKSFRHSRGLSQLVVGIESTGVYGQPLVHFLRNKGVAVVQVNPMHTKRVKELQGNSPNKTDQKDPKVIADLMQLGRFLTVVVPEGTAADLRHWIHARERAVEHRKVFSNQLHSLVFLVFPEMIPIMKGPNSKSMRYLLEHFPSPSQIVSCGQDNLSNILRKVSRGKLGRDRAHALYNAARDSVGITEGDQSILFEIKAIIQQMKSIEGLIQEIEIQIKQALKHIPYSKFLLSMRGIGEITVAGLIGEFGDFSQFHALREMIKFAGLDLYEISSGQRKGKRRISKRGRALIRKLLFFAALRTVRKGGIMHRKYLLHLAQGMEKKQALIAIAKKLLSIMAALARSHSMYIEGYEQHSKIKEAA